MPTNEPIPIKEAFQIIDDSRHPAGFTRKVFSIKYHTQEKNGVSRVVTINRACKGMYVVHDPKVHGTLEKLAKQEQLKQQESQPPATPTTQGATRDYYKLWDLDYQNTGRKSGWHTIYYDQIRAVNDRLVFRPVTQGE